MKLRFPRAVAAIGTVFAVLVMVAATPSANAQEPAAPAPALDELIVPDESLPEIGGTPVEPSLLSASGTVTVSLELPEPALAEAVGEDAHQVGSALSSAEQADHTAELEAAQQELLDRLSGLDIDVVTTTQVASNLVVAEVDADLVPALAAQPDVVKVLPVVDFELDLSETVPHIGADVLQNEQGLTGEGVKVAVLDTGIDYTHEAFGGDGTLAAYQAAYGTSVDDPANTQLDGLFPTDRVVAGFDFVGDFWFPDGPALNPNPDPIDCGPAAIPAPCSGGHGTTVAAILAGADGVAPEADLYAYTVCSSVSNSCSGVAILQGFEAALDPDGSGTIEDAVDVINMSVGAPYGQIENPSSGAAATAVRMGVTTVISAGNSADKPFITGSPASTPEVISAAWTELPSALALQLTVSEPAEIAGDYPNTNTVGWAPITDGFAGEIAYGSTGAEQLGCFVDENGEPSGDDTGISPYPAGFFDGKVAFMDRGVCAVSFKTHNAAEAGAAAVVVANNVPGAAPSFSFGGPDPFAEVQTLIVGLETGNALRDGLATGAPVLVEVDPDQGIPLINSMNASSSRGPSMSEVAIKPDIGAPGASTAAEAGTGAGTRVFGGTSGAAPMVAGSAALMLQAYPERSPLEIKAALMNNAETEIFISPGQRPGELAEISRIGGGEVRVDAAHASSAAAWSAEDHSAGLSFGYQSVSHLRILKKSVTVRNYSDRLRVYRFGSSFRHANDEASGAVRFLMPPLVVVPAGGTTTVPVIMRIDPRKLPDWVLNGGPGGASGELLRENEFDGYLTLTGGGEQLTLPWHVLPHRASSVRAPDQVRSRGGSATANLINIATSGQTASGDVFALTGTSPAFDTLPGEGDGAAVVDLAAVGVRMVGDDTIQFGINTHNLRSHPNAPATFQVFIDVDRDGTPDFRVFNWDLDFPVNGITNGQNVVWFEDLQTGAFNAAFFTDTNLVSGNIILTAPLAAIGLAPGSQFDFSVLGVDLYFTGAVTDAIEDMTFTVGQPRYTSDEVVEVASPGLTRLVISEVPGGAAASPSQSGVLVLWRDGMVGGEAAAITVAG